MSREHLAMGERVEALQALKSMDGEPLAREAAQLLLSMLVAQRLENLIEPHIMDSYMVELRKHL